MDKKLFAKLSVLSQVTGDLIAAVDTEPKRQELETESNRQSDTNA